MASTLREELASLKIERSEFDPSRAEKRWCYRVPPQGGGLRLLSWMLWLIPLSIIGGAGYVGYREYDRVRSKTEVTVGLVQRMTTGEAEKLLSAKGYLKSQKQAMIGTKVAGRVEEMRVREHDQVKTGDILAVIEHHDLLAMIEQRKAGMEKTKADLDEVQGRPLGERPRSESGRTPRGQEDGAAGRLRKGFVGPKDGRRAGRGARGFAQDDEGQHRRDGVYAQVPDAHPRAV